MARRKRAWLLALLLAPVGCWPMRARREEGRALVRAAGRFDEFRVAEAERVRDAAIKVARLRGFMKANGWEAAVIGKEPDFNWITGGGTSSGGLADRAFLFKLVITPTAKYLVSSNGEAARILDEELRGLGYEAKGFSWHTNEAAVLEPLVRGGKVVSDVPLACCPGATVIESCADLYWPLTELELRRYRWLGRKTSAALERVGRVVRPGMSELDAAYLLQKELAWWAIAATVSAAADARAMKYARPPPTTARLAKYLVMSVRARRWGLTVAATRAVHFGRNHQLEAMFRRNAVVAAKVWAATRPGRTLGDVLEAARRAYAEAGFPDEWRLHHQGGPIAYLERTAMADPRQPMKIRSGMAFAWNPTLQGATMEDTCVLSDAGIEVLTPCTDWPTIEVTLGAQTYRMPGLLIR